MQRTLKASPYDEFIDSLRTDATKKRYAEAIRWFTKDPDGFLKLAKRSRRRAEQDLINFFKKERNRVAAATLRLPPAAMKSFLEYHEVELNWKKVKNVLPAGRKVARDRGPSVDEIRKLLDHANPRGKAIALILASSGMRVGGFEDLRIRHLKRLDSGVARLIVYAGSTEEYDTFVTAECLAAIDDYLRVRVDIAKEEITADSPLIRDQFQFEKYFHHQ